MIKINTLALVSSVAWATIACGGATPPAAEPSNSGTSPDPMTSGPGAGEPTDSAPKPGVTDPGTSTQSKATGGEGVTPDTGSTGSGPGNSASPTGSGTAGH